MSLDGLDAVDEHGFLSEGFSRIGKDHPTSVLWQGDRRWRDLAYGNGGLRVWGAGCVATGIAEACRRLGAMAGADPRTVLERASRVTPPVFDPGSSLAFIGRMARTMGLKCSDDPIVATRGSDEAKARHLRFAITRTLADGGVCLVHVDKNADGKGDHWLCVHQATPTHLWGTDSATARIEKLELEALTGTARWDEVEKTYRVLRVRPLTI
jgi:hypothetical protein